MSFEPLNPYDAGVIATVQVPSGTLKTAAELSELIKAGDGRVIALPGESPYIVAVSNPLRFSVARLADGTYQITESYTWIFLIGAAVVGVVLLSRR